MRGPYRGKKLLPFGESRKGCCSGVIGSFKKASSVKKFGLVDQTLQNWLKGGQKGPLNHLNTGSRYKVRILDSKTNAKSFRTPRLGSWRRRLRPLSDLRIQICTSDQIFVCAEVPRTMRLPWLLLCLAQSANLLVVGK